MNYLMNAFVKGSFKDFSHDILKLNLIPKNCFVKRLHHSAVPISNSYYEVSKEREGVYCRPSFTKHSVVTLRQLFKRISLYTDKTTS